MELQARLEKSRPDSLTKLAAEIKEAANPREFIGKLDVNAILEQDINTNDLFVKWLGLISVGCAVAFVMRVPAECLGVLVKSGSELVYTIESHPDIAGILLEKDSLRELIKTGYQLVRIIRARPDLADSLLYYDHQPELIKDGDQLVRLITAYPDVAEILLSDVRLRCLIKNFLQVFEIIEACPALADHFLSDKAICGLIETRDQFVQLLKVDPAVAEILSKDAEKCQFVEIENDDPFAELITAHPTVAGVVLLNSRLCKLMKSFYPELKFIARLLGLAELFAEDGLKKDGQQLVRIIEVHSALAKGLLDDDVRDSLEDGYQIAELIRAYPAIAGMVLENDRLCKLIADCDQLVAVISACSDEMADRLLDDDGLCKLIENSYDAISIIEEHPDLAFKLFEKGRLCELIEDGWNLAGIIEICPAIADKLLDEELGLCDLIDDSEQLVRIIAVRPDLAKSLLKKSRLNELIRDGNHLVELIYEYLDAADELLNDERLCGLIEDGDQLACIVEVRPTLADKLLGEELGLCDLIDEGEQLVRIIAVRPDLAKSLLRKSRLNKLIQNGDQLVELIFAYSDAADELLNDKRLYGLIENDDQCARIIKVRPDLVGQLLDLNDESSQRRLLKKGRQLVSIIQKNPSVARLLLNDVFLYELIDDAKQMLNIISVCSNDVAESLLRKLLKADKLNWLIDSFDRFDKLARICPAVVAMSLDAGLLYDLIKNGEQLVISIVRHPDLVVLLDDDHWRGLIQDSSQLADIIEARPAVADKLLDDPRLRQLMQYDYQLVRIIKLRPDLAKTLLKDNRLNELIQNGDKLAEFIVAYPSLAEILLNDYRLGGLIVNCFQLADIIEARPDLADELLDGEDGLRDLIENGNQLVRIIEASPAVADKLLNDEHGLLGLIQYQYQIDRIKAVRPDLAKDLSEYERVRGLERLSKGFCQIVSAWQHKTNSDKSPAVKLGVTNKEHCFGASVKRQFKQYEKEVLNHYDSLVPEAKWQKDFFNFLQGSYSGLSGQVGTKAAFKKLLNRDEVEGVDLPELTRLKNKAAEHDCEDFYGDYILLYCVDQLADLDEDSRKQYLELKDLVWTQVIKGVDKSPLVARLVKYVSNNKFVLQLLIDESALEVLEKYKSNGANDNTGSTDIRVKNTDSDDLNMTFRLFL